VKVEHEIASITVVDAAQPDDEDGIVRLEEEEEEEDP